MPDQTADQTGAHFSTLSYTFVNGVKQLQTEVFFCPKCPPPSTEAVIPIMDGSEMFEWFKTKVVGELASLICSGQSFPTDQKELLVLHTMCVMKLICELENSLAH